MRDIRKDLRERIDGIRSQQEHLAFRIKELDKQANMLEILLDQEEKDWEARQPTLFGAGELIRKVRTHSQLGKFLLESLRDGNTHTTEELVGLVQKQGIPVKGKSPRRAVHFALVGMKQNKLVEMPQSRVWKLRNGGGESKEEKVGDAEKAQTET